MSKRFGRNQRRRAREALASAEQRIGDLQLAIKMDRELLRSQSIQIAAANDFTREVAEMVGREAIIAGHPVALNYKCQRHDSQLQFAPKQRMPSLSDMVESATITRVRDETLFLLDIEAVADVMRHQTHVHVTMADNTVGYGISGSALRSLTVNELERRLVPEIANLMAKKLKLRK